MPTPEDPAPDEMVMMRPQPAVDHRVDHGMYTVQHTSQVDLDGAVPFGRLHLPERFRPHLFSATVAGVVDENVDERVFGEFGLDGVEIGHIERCWFSRSSLCGDLIGNRSRSFGEKVVDQNMCPLGCQSRGDARPHVLPCPGDQRRLVG